MSRFGFCGATYTSQSRDAADERCLNLYPESVESANGKSPIALYPTPGLQLAIALTSPGAGSSVRAIKESSGGFFPWQHCIAIVGAPCGANNAVYMLSVSGTTIVAAGTTGGTGLGSTFQQMRGISICSGGGPIPFFFFCIDGIPYYYQPGGTVTSLAGVIGGGGDFFSQVAYCDGFFMALVANSNQWFVSAPFDVTTWPGAATAAVSVFTDNVVSMIVNQRQVLMLGQTASITYYDSGNFPFPFDVIAGSYIEQGCAAAASPVKLDNSIFWLGDDNRGEAIVWRLSGYTPQRVSNHAVEFAMQGYSQEFPSNGNTYFGNGIDDAIGYGYQDQGHSFYVLYFPSANGGNGATWVFDVATNSWHERCYLNVNTEQAHRSQCHSFVSLGVTGNAAAKAAGAIHLVGDWASTNIYQMQIPTANGTVWSFADDFGNPIKRLRRTPHINIEKEWMRYDELVIDMETGLGPIPALTGNSTLPTSVIVAAPNGGLWKVTLDNSGALVVISSGIGPPQTIILNDPPDVTNSFQFGVSNLGIPTFFALPYLPIYPLLYPMATTPGLLQSGISFNTVTPFAAPRPPQLLLHWSKDGGHTFSPTQIIGFGLAGDFGERVRMSRMGRARQMLFEVWINDPVPVRFMDAYLKATAFQPEERLIKKLAKSA